VEIRLRPAGYAGQFPPAGENWLRLPGSNAPKAHKLYPPQADGDPLIKSQAKTSNTPCLLGFRWFVMPSDN